jgi:hypothetical protein
MTREQEKKSVERRYVEILKAKMPQFPVGLLRAGERPDFIVEGPLRIGIEVTTYNSTSRDDEAIFDQLIALAQLEHRRRGGQPCDARFICSLFPRTEGRSKSEIALELADVVGLSLRECWRS